MDQDRDHTHDMEQEQGGNTDGSIDANQLEKSESEPVETSPQIETTTSEESLFLNLMNLDDKGDDESIGFLEHKPNLHEYNEFKTSEVVLRKFKRIPIFMVDYHNDVLEFIYRCLGGRFLPLHGNTLLHFDSHPDMVISRELLAYEAYDKEVMLSELSIENWIMPACYTGNFNRIIWVKNSWCQQIPVGKYNFKVGNRNHYIGVDCPIDYFISEGNYCKTSELKEVRDVELHVIDADSENGPHPKDLLSPATTRNYILDIDLDFFSTSNPFLEIYSAANCYEQLREIFHFDYTANSDAAHNSDARKAQLDALKSIFEYLVEKRTLQHFEKHDYNVISKKVFAKIVTLAETLQRCYDDEQIDWMQIYNAGCTTDFNSLPHHISTDSELDCYYEQFKQFLKKLPQTPTIITLASSSEDDYCPCTQVIGIQEKVLAILKEVFGDKVHDMPIIYPMKDLMDIRHF